MAVQEGWLPIAFNYGSAMLPGFIAGITAQSKPVIHGAMAGVAVVVGMVSFWIATGVIGHATPTSLVHTLVHFVGLASLGAIIAKWRSSQ